MRLMFSLSSFAFTMVLALFAFTYTAIYFPSTMRELLAGADHMVKQISRLGLSDSFMVWVDIFLEPKQVVLVGFSIFVRLLIAIIGRVFGSRPRLEPSSDGSPPPAPSSSNSPFSRWG